jgi:nucleotide-binding universal stress UspA family protein
MKRIIVATDFSESARHAVATGARLAKRAGAELVLVHACNVAGTQPDHYELARGKLDPYRQELRHELGRRRDQLAQLRLDLARDGLAVSQRVVDGHPEEAIPEIADEVAADLVITGTRASGNILLGSIAERVARSCRRPVLIAREPLPDVAGFHNLLVPTDFEAHALAAARLAAELTAPGAHLELFHAWSVGRSAADYLQLVGRREAYDELREAAVAEAYRRGRELASRFERPGLSVAFSALAGSPDRAILERAEDTRPRYDLIAVGSHGRSGWQRFVIGSVAEAVVRYANCSVLVAHGD